jgi:CubicO group peptidase (beta-lactamase class C family)
MLYGAGEASGDGKPTVFGHSGSDGTWAWAWPELDLMVLYFTQSRGNRTGITLERTIERLLVKPEQVDESP